MFFCVCPKAFTQGVSLCIEYPTSGQFFSFFSLPKPLSTVNFQSKGCEIK